MGVSEIDPNRLPGGDAEPLPADARMRWDAFKSAVGELAAATDDTAGLEAAAAAVQQIMRGLDAEQYADALNVPEDAGEFADGLRGILMRIPDGWGRWISCERGWYPLLTKLHGELAVLLPRYRIFQVKEKFAGLRFYWESGERTVDPNDPEPSVVGEAASPTEEARLLADHEAWQRRLFAYLDTREGRARKEDLDRRIALANHLVKHAAALATRTCERCGVPGECCQRRNGAWYKTLCVTCANAAGYEPVPDNDAD